MRGLSLTQPWASLLAAGAKSIETRSWSTAYRGELVIQAAQKFPTECRSLCYLPAFASALIKAGYDNPGDLPRGRIVGVTRLVEVIPTTDIVQIWDRVKDPGDGRFEDSDEYQFGDYEPGRFGWLFTNVKRATSPVPCKGALGLWSVPQIVVDLLAGQGLL